MHGSILGCHGNFHLLCRARDVKCLCVTVSHNCRISVVVSLKCSLVTFDICISMKYITRIYYYEFSSKIAYGKCLHKMVLLYILVIFYIWTEKWEPWGNRRQKHWQIIWNKIAVGLEDCCMNSIDHQEQKLKCLWISRFIYYVQQWLKSWFVIWELLSTCCRSGSVLDFKDEKPEKFGLCPGRTYSLVEEKSRHCNRLTASVGSVLYQQRGGTLGRPGRRALFRQSRENEAELGKSFQVYIS